MQVISEFKSLTLGGEVPEHVVPDLCARLRVAQVRESIKGPLFQPENGTDLQEACNTYAGKPFLRVYGGTTQFGGLPDFFQFHKIRFILMVPAQADIPARRWSLGPDGSVFPASCDVNEYGVPTVTVDVIRDVLDTITVGCQSSHHSTDERFATIRRTAGQFCRNLPQVSIFMPEFSIID
jgi:hypothetical protein